MPAPPKPATAGELLIVEQLARIADAVERLAHDFDHNNQHGFVADLMSHLRVISQKHR